MIDKSFTNVFFLFVTGKNLYNNEHVAIKMVICTKYFLKLIKFKSVWFKKINSSKCVIMENLSKEKINMFLNILQEPMKAKAPQLHLEYRFYKVLGAHGELIFIQKYKIKKYFFSL